MAKIKRIFRDLQQSWYFRGYVLFWLILVVVWFVGLGFLAERSTEAEKHQILEYYTTNEGRIYYPRFQFRFGKADQQNITQARCSYGFYGNITMPTTIGKCATLIGDDTPADNYCLLVDPTKLYASPGKTPKDPVANNRLTCIVALSNGGLLPITGDGRQMAFELLDNSAYGPNSGADVWISPTLNAWVLLNKAIYDGDTRWERTLLYHSAVPPTDITHFWQVTVVINSFTVDHYEKKVIYDGWMASADVGGFITFLAIFHVLAMLIVGLFCTNDSHFLRDEEDIVSTSYGSTI